MSRRPTGPELTEQEWLRLLPMLSMFKPERREAMHNRLVKGMTLAEAGRAHSYSKQDVAFICKRAMEQYAKLQASLGKPPVPPNHVRVEFIVPRSRVAEVRRVVEALYPQPSPAAPSNLPRKRTRRT